MLAILVHELARIAGRALQLLLHLADLDGQLAHHAHQVVEQLRRHARGRHLFASHGLGCRSRRFGVRIGGRHRQRTLADRVGSVIAARRIEQLDDAHRIVGGAVFAGDGRHHLLQTVGGGGQRLRAQGGRRGLIGLADLEDVFQAVREFRHAADAENVGGALERVRGAFRVPQEFGLFAGSTTQPCSDCVTSAACGGESCRKASSSAPSTSFEISSARSATDSASGAACSVSSSAAPMPFAAWSSSLSAASASPSSGSGTQSPPKCASSASTGLRVGGVAQMHFEHARPVGEEAARERRVRPAAG